MCLSLSFETITVFLKLLLIINWHHRKITDQSMITLVNSLLFFKFYFSFITVMHALMFISYIPKHKIMDFFMRVSFWYCAYFCFFFFCSGSVHFLLVVYFTCCVCIYPYKKNIYAKLFLSLCYSPLTAHPSSSFDTTER
jgi:hypothetical protein